MRVEIRLWSDLDVDRVERLEEEMGLHLFQYGFKNRTSRANNKRLPEFIRLSWISNKNCPEVILKWDGANHLDGLIHKCLLWLSSTLWICSHASIKSECFTCAVQIQALHCLVNICGMVCNILHHLVLNDKRICSSFIDTDALWWLNLFTPMHFAKLGVTLLSVSVLQTVRP